MSRFQRGGLAFQKPENALKRAEELIAVGQPGSALQTLHDVITSKRHRTWQKVLEQIMLRYIELCVDLKKGRYAKDGLIHYRNVCQQVNVSSLEEVIKFFLKTATDKAEQAQSKAEAQTVTLDVEDLEVDATPEDLMLSYVSGEKGKDRTDREVVTPWFKFLWETYRTILDVLRNNSRLEALYAMTATRAFQFCLNYRRTTEFRRLCDILRNHLNSLNKYRDARDRPDLTAPETLQLYLDSRFEQLRVACELELWQEAFRSVEDIQGLLSYLGKRPAKPQMMALYFARLTKIFTVSDCHLYNGYAWYKLFNLAKTYNKNLTAQDVQQLSCNVLLSALSILPYEALETARTEAELDLEKERSLRMATILGFSLDPRKDPRHTLTRSALLADLTAKGLLNLVPEPIKALYTTLDQDFSPLQLCKKLAPLLEGLENLDQPLSAASPVQVASLGQYRKSLQQVAVLRLLQQLGQVYSVMKIGSLKNLIPFMNFGEVEAIIVEAVKSEFIQARVDHKHGTVHFGGLEPESDQLRDHIALLTKRLRIAACMVQPEGTERDVRKKELLHEAIASAVKDNERMAGRKMVIEKKKEEQERLLLQAEKEEEEKRIKQERLSVAAEEERRRLDRLKREEDRIAREIAEKEEEETRAVWEQHLAAHAGKIKLPTGDKLDKAAILNQVRTEQQRAKEEAERKLQRYIRQLDHFERARREEEAPSIEAAHKKQVAEGEVEHEEEQKRLIQLHHEAWETDIKEKHRLQRMTDAKDRLAADIMSRRATEFERLKRERDQEVKRLKEERHQARELKRKEAYVKQCRLEIEEKRLKEEMEAVQRLEEQKAREEAERKRKQDELFEKQRKRELELEEKRRQEREEMLNKKPTPAPAVSSDGPPKASGAFVPPHLRRQQAAAAGSAPAPPLGNQWRREDSSAPAHSQASNPPAPDARRGRGQDPPRFHEPQALSDKWRPQRRSEPEQELRPSGGGQWESGPPQEGGPPRRGSSTSWQPKSREARPLQPPQPSQPQSRPRW